MAVKDYQDPRWQRVRLKIMERDGFKCSVCREDGKILHVHHRAYEKKKKIWDAHPSHLVTLCEDCHERCENIVRIARMSANQWLMFHNSFCDGNVNKSDTPIEVMAKCLDFTPPDSPDSIPIAVDTIEYLLKMFDTTARCVEEIIARELK